MKDSSAPSTSLPGERWIVTALTKETMLSRTLAKLAKVPDHAKFIGYKNKAAVSAFLHSH
jgi:hypothetical protein